MIFWVFYVKMIGVDEKAYGDLAERKFALVR
jgi:hypothetical protein